MTTTEWLRAKIGPSPNPRRPEQITRKTDPTVTFFTRHLRPEMRLLHAYAGDGRISHALSRFVPMGQVVGIEPIADLLLQARELDVIEEGGEVVFERAGLHDTPFGSDSFDAALIDGVFSTERSPERALEEVKRLLVPGGMLGVRHTAASSRVFAGDDPVLEHALRRKDGVVLDTGGDPDAGLKQVEWLRNAGFVNVRVSSSTEQRLGKDLMAELLAEGFVPPDSIPGPEDEPSTAISFITAIQTVCWKPA